MKKKNDLFVGILCSAALLLNGCSWMGSNTTAGAIGHMLFGAVVALTAVFAYGKLKK